HITRVERGPEVFALARRSAATSHWLHPSLALTIRPSSVAVLAALLNAAIRRRKCFASQQKPLPGFSRPSTVNQVRRSTTLRPSYVESVRRIASPRRFFQNSATVIASAKVRVIGAPPCRSPFSRTADSHAHGRKLSCRSCPSPRWSADRPAAQRDIGRRHGQ